MTAIEIVNELKGLGNEQTKRILINHGAKEPCFGIKIEDLKKVLKKAKADTNVALELFDTGIYDAMYLAGLIANGAEMSKQQIEKWAETAYGLAISEYTVPWVATESSFGWDLALQWIDSDIENIMVTGWATLASIISVKPDETLNVLKMKTLLHRVENEIHSAPNHVRGLMNNFVISVGSYVVELSDDAIKTAASIGKVTVLKKGTACKVPSATDYIEKVKAKGYLGKKRKEVKC